MDDVINECNFKPKNSNIDKNIRILHCMVDNGKCINIHPDGTLGVCEHYIDSDNWGYINEEGEEVVTNWEYVHEWRDYLIFDRCKDCKIYPTCVRTRKCEDLCTCDVFYQEYKYVQERKVLEEIYDNFLKMLEERNNCCDGYSCSCGNGQDNSTCECVTQRCDSKENWCYCISQKEEIEHLKENEQKTCNEKTCTSKKETIEEDINDNNKNNEQVIINTDNSEQEKKSFFEKFRKFFD